MDTGKGWVLHCGDAYYVKEDLRLKGKASVGVRIFRRFAHEYSFPRAMDQLSPAHFAHLRVDTAFDAYRELPRYRKLDARYQAWKAASK